MPVRRVAEPCSGCLLMPVSLPVRIRSSTRAWPRWRISRSASWPPRVAVRKAVKAELVVTLGRRPRDGALVVRRRRSAVVRPRNQRRYESERGPRMLCTIAPAGISEVPCSLSYQLQQFRSELVGRFAKADRAEDQRSRLPSPPQHRLMRFRRGICRGRFAGRGTAGGRLVGSRRVGFRTSRRVSPRRGPSPRRRRRCRGRRGRGTPSRRR
ncbi:hypothetical protein EV652_102605 [Kribbella steppae]|uniref:Uncharacterized protein n=1 Tax=Kribbella steppae TaxID=2512223 RepID=A0A4R2HU31_9ACTN|nr:hypothetical protein EV652_102605 [Kribbella steppae]